MHLTVFVQRATLSKNFPNWQPESLRQYTVTIAVGMNQNIKRNLRVEKEA
jgi:hypothetical protein